MHSLKSFQQIGRPALLFLALFTLGRIAVGLQSVVEPMSLLPSPSKLPQPGVSQALHSDIYGGVVTQTDPCAAERARLTSLENELRQLSNIPGAKAEIEGVREAAMQRIERWHQKNDLKVYQLRQRLASPQCQPIQSAIDQKYAALGGARGFLGAPTSGEMPAPDGRGRFRHFQHGSIYWTPSTGAHEVHGAIRDKWAALGWERSFLGYPRSDESSVVDNNVRINNFEGGAIVFIDQPNVKVSSAEYSIGFSPGQRVRVDAGGCVQTGGIGMTWKRYVDPQGPNSDHLYHGQIWVPGATRGLVRLQRVIGRDLWVTPDRSPSASDRLRLGYEDDDYSDNGYWGHDDGTGGQCIGVGPAWVILTIEYNPPNPPNPLPPPITDLRIESFTASPNNGYIQVGQSATLNWQVSGCERNCNVSLQGHEGLGNLVLNIPHVSQAGTQQVTPHFNTTYTLTVTAAGGDRDSREVRVRLYGSTPSGSLFYFKMTNSQSWVTPCFTIAVFAADQMTAKRIAEAQNGGYTATPIDASQFNSACN